MNMSWIAYMAAAGGLALGAGWTEVDAGLPRSSVRSAMFLHDPSSASTVYAVGQSGSLFKSTDGGGTWNIVGGVSGVGSLAVGPGDSSTLYAVAHGIVLKSVDAGQSWVNASAGLSSASS
jgi:photosystem II stability/assembly factor-like uncharacterized protein